MYQALYRACRPEVFEEILGQEHVVKILSHQLKTDTTSHAYLFCGTRGTGKTTTARILAKGLNCISPNEKGGPCGKCRNCQQIKEGTFIDVVEIDAASNNGVDNIRELRESVNYPPQIGRKKVYIIDEVHMLSPGAFNALLKTLEEPPENVVFILATTEPEKLLKTIQSRCMRLDFKRVPVSIILSGMKKIVEERGVNIEESALRLVANAADGSVRDGLSILDQVLSSGEKNLSRDDVLLYMGAVSEDFFIELTDLVSLKKTSDALILLDKALADGKEVKQIEKDWLSHYRNLLITKFIKNPEDLLNMSGDNIRKVREQSMHISIEEINDAILKLSKTINDSRYSTQSRVLLELAIVSISARDYRDTVEPRKKEPVKEVARPVETVEKKEDPVKAESPVETPKEYVKKENKKAVLDGLEIENGKLAEVWQDVISAGEKEMGGSFTVVKTGTELERIDQMTFFVLCSTNFASLMAEQRRCFIEKFMTEKLNRPMRMILGVKEKKEEKGPDAEEVKKKAEDFLGMKITLE